MTNRSSNAISDNSIRRRPRPIETKHDLFALEVTNDISGANSNLFSLDMN